ncbi:MAG: multicopper oxidase domain-containing protein [Rhodospirillales bacterium]|nr:multicopper oxidase domain-containing protein [Rhodospirillales bacterium]
MEIPKEGGVFPILALREAAIERTGILLVTKGALVKKITGEGRAASKLLDLSLEQRLVAVTPLAARKPDRELVVELGQIMGKYLWTLNGQAYGQNEPLKVKKGERVELTMVNHTTMMHSMHLHLHGHHFQVVAGMMTAVDYV